MLSFYQPKKIKPNYTVRMLVVNTKELSLNKFSHFTLGCTLEDESEKIIIAMKAISAKLTNPLSLRACEVINLNTASLPLWGIKLDFDNNEAFFRKIFSVLDQTMCQEKDGHLYVWDITQVENAKKRCPHITLGPLPSDYIKAKKLVESKAQLIFGQIDYKKIGQHDPLYCLLLKNSDRHYCEAKL